MNIIGMKVVHRDFGEGTVTKHSDNYINVSFIEKNMEFQYPDSFLKYLRTDDAQFNEMIKSDQRIAIEKAQEKKMFEEVDKKSKGTFVAGDAQNIFRYKKQSVPGSIVFKCNYCDGGKSTEQIGYAGACSDEIIDYNISVKNRIWCSDVDSPCRQYWESSQDKEARKDLDAINEDGGYVCYESQMLTNWKAAAGISHTGVNRGVTRKLKRIQPNSLCILTTRDPYDEGEKKRYVFAVFIIDEMYEGDSEDEGYVACNSEYKLKLSDKEAHLISYWNYHSNDSQPTRALWGSGLYRYISNVEAAQILRDIVKIKEGKREAEKSKLLYEYFCMVNKIDKKALPVASGALQ